MHYARFAICSDSPHERRELGPSVQVALPTIPPVDKE